MELHFYIGSEQPATCPMCGCRTHILEEDTIYQHHLCLSGGCEFEFILEFEEDIEI